MKFTQGNAIQQGFLLCTVCAQLARRHPAADQAQYCPRCCARLLPRKAHSVQRSWAWLISAYIFYLPANLLPIMDTHSLFDAQQDTILSGVLFLWHTGSWVTAGIVFMASIFTPIAKLIALTALLLSVHFKATRGTKLRTNLYRLLLAIGRWSMLDIFVVAVLAALVHIQTFAVIEAGPGALAFGAVVVCTLLAAASFDPRLIWDAKGQAHG